MKHILFVSIFLSFQVYFYAQEIALDNVPNSDLNYNYHDPIKTISGIPPRPWPDCVAPEGLKAVKMPNGDIQLLWDEKNNKSDNFSYEIKYQSSNLRSVVNELIDKNNYTVPAEEIDMNFDFYVRRVCNINGQKVESEWVKLTVLYLAVNGQECNSMNQQLDDNGGANAQYYAVYQKTGNCLYIQWNLPNSCMRPSFWLNETEIIVNPSKLISGDTIITLSPTQNTKFQFIEMHYSHNPGGACTYLCPVFIDYFGIYSDQCPVPCTNSNYCDYVNSILGNTTNDYYALAHYEQGNSCINFKWNFQNQIAECSGAWPQTIKINLLNGSNSTTVYGPVNQLSGDTLYYLPQGISFTDVEYEYTSTGGNSGNQTCSYIVNRTFSDFGLTPQECGIGPMQYFCELNYNFQAVATNNSIVMSIKPNTINNSELLEYIDEYNVDSIAVFFYFGQYGEFRASLYNGQSNFNINQWSHQIYGVSGAQIVSPINIIVYKDGDTQGEGCTGYGTVEIQLSDDQDKICEILAFLLQSNPVSNSIRFDFNHPTDPAYLKNKLLGLGFQSYAAAETYFKSKVKTLTFKLNYKYKNASNNTVSATLTKIITQSSGIPFNAVVATFNSSNFSTFEPFADMEIVVHNTAHNSMDFSCYRQDIEYKASKLPVYSCEGNYVVPVIDPTKKLPKLMLGDVAKIAGFSFIVDSIGNSNNPPFSGRGILAHPFTLAGAEPILVRFYNIELNTDYEVYAGVVRGVEASPAEFAQMGFNTTPDTFSIGGEICLPPPPKQLIPKRGSMPGVSDPMVSM